MPSFRSLTSCGIATVLAGIASCSSGPPAVTQPSIDPSGAGELAMEQYDTNGDGNVAGDELEKAPALAAALPRLDTNKDGGVSAEEVAERINVWKGMKTGMTGITCKVTLDGQPIPGAKVVFEPEPFLGDEIKAASSTTNSHGDVSPVVAKEDRPDPSVPGGIYFGFYRVRITRPDQNGKESIPARYNTDTTLGYEVSYDNPAFSRGHEFALKSK
jgi:hypothetical protein